ncbi:hypothetical protein BT69DRAFT_1320061 [Atractiella rhizophila]|nr:hypothetical protein BT69DRAFT_1320061 [Atractiella rhizophila]
MTPWSICATLTPDKEGAYIHSSIAVDGAPVFGSDSGIHVFSTESNKIQKSIPLQGGCIALGGASSSGGVYALCREECNKIDWRSGKVTHKFHGTTGKDYTALSHEWDNTVVLGTTTTLRSNGREEEGVLEVWDARKATVPTHSYSIHSGDLTSLAWATLPSIQKVHLLSGGTDGIVNFIDPSIMDEEDAVLHTVNVGVSVAEVVLTSLGSERPSKRRKVDVEGNEDEGKGTLTVRTDIESVGSWRFLGDGEEEGFVVKEELKEVRKEGEIDYVVSLEVERGRMWVGDNQGNLKSRRLPWISKKTNETWSLPSGSGHTDIVRTVLYDEQNDICYSGGEDGRIVCWKRRTCME